MSVIITMGGKAPENTNIIMGSIVNLTGDNVDVFVDIDKESVENKTIFDIMFTFIGQDKHVEIQNSPYTFTGNHVTSLSTGNDVKIIDYLTMNIEDKLIIDNAILLLRK